MEKPEPLTLQQMYTAAELRTFFKDKPSLPFQPRKPDVFVVTITLCPDQLLPDRASYQRYQYAPAYVQYLDGLKQWEIRDGAWSMIRDERHPFGMGVDRLDMVKCLCSEGFRPIGGQVFFAFEDENHAKICVAGALAAFETVAHTVSKDFTE